MNSKNNLLLLKFKPIKILSEITQIKLQVICFVGNENKSREGIVKDYHNKNMVYSPLELYLVFATERTDKNKSVYYNVESPILLINYSAMIEAVKITSTENHKHKGVLFLNGSSYMGHSLYNSTDKLPLLELCDIYSITPVFTKDERSHGDFPFSLAKRIVKEDFMQLKKNYSYQNSYSLWKWIGKRFWFRKTSSKGYSLLLFDFIRVFGVDIGELLDEKEKLVLNRIFTGCVGEMIDPSEKSGLLKRKLGRGDTIDEQTNLLLKLSSCLLKIYFCEETTNERCANLVRRYVPVYDIIVHLLFSRMLYKECHKTGSSKDRSPVEFQENLIEFLSKNMEVGKKILSGILGEEILSRPDDLTSTEIKKMMLSTVLGRLKKGKHNLVNQIFSLSMSFSHTLEKINQGENIFIVMTDINQDIDNEEDLSDTRIEESRKKQQKNIDVYSQKNFIFLEEKGLLEKTNLSVWSSSGYVSMGIVKSLKKLGKIFSEINRRGGNVNCEHSKSETEIEDVYTILSKKTISAIPFHFPLHEFSVYLNNLFLSNCLVVSKDSWHSKFCQGYYNLKTVTCNDLVEFLNINMGSFTEKPSEKKCLNKIWGINTIDCGCCRWNEPVVQDYLSDIYAEYRNPNYVPKPRLEKKKKVGDAYQMMADVKNIEYLKHIVFVDTEKYGLKEITSLIDYISKFSLVVSNKTKSVSIITRVASKLTFLGNCDSPNSSAFCEYQFNAMKFFSKVGNDVVYFSGIHPLFQKFTPIDYEYYEICQYNQLGNNFTDREIEIDSENTGQHEKYLYPNLVVSPLKAIQKMFYDSKSEGVQNSNEENEDDNPEEEAVNIREWEIVDLFSNTLRSLIMSSCENSPLSQEEMSFKYVFLGINDFSSQIITQKIEGIGDIGNPHYILNETERESDPFFLKEGLKIIIEERKKKYPETQLVLKIYSEYFKENPILEELADYLFDLVYIREDTISESDEEFGKLDIETVHDLFTGETYIKKDHRVVVVEYTKKDQQSKKNDTYGSLSNEKQSFEINCISRFELVDPYGNNINKKEKYIFKEVSDNYSKKRTRCFSNKFPLHISSNDPRVDALPLSMRENLTTQKVFPVYQSHPITPADIIVFFVSGRTTWNTILKLVENTHKCIIFVYIANERRSRYKEDVEAEEGCTDEDDIFRGLKRDIKISQQDKNAQITTNRYYNIVDICVEKYIEHTKKYYTFIPMTNKMDDHLSNK